MRISVLGHSDSTGKFLPPGTTTWPELVRDNLSEKFGEPVELDSWRWAPFLPGSVEFALDRVDAANPDFVVLPLAAFWCAFSIVQTRVNQRFGARAGTFYRRTEQVVTTRLEGRVIPKSVTRRVARTVLGTAPEMTVPQFIGVHQELIRELSRREHLQVLVLGDHHFDEANRKLMPLIPKAIAQINREIRPVVAERRLLWDDMDEALCKGGRREEMMLPDGVHMTGEGHRRLAEMVTPHALSVAATLSRGPRE